MVKFILKDKLLFSLIALLIIAVGIFTYVLIRMHSNSTDVNETENNADSIKSASENINIDLNKKYSLADFYNNNDAVLSKKIDIVYSKLSNEEQIGQMIVVAAGKYGKSKDIVNGLITSKKIGGVLLLKGSRDEFTNLIKEFTKTASNTSGSLPLIFSCDAEPSLINMKISGSPEFPETSSIKNYEQAYKIGNEIAQYIHGLGFHQNFAPVCDFDKNKEIIGDRSFGHSTENVTALANEFIKATQKNNIVATAKHFPGHGNVKGDSHKGIVTVEGEPAEKEVFKKVIQEGVISIMIGHIAINGSKKYDTDGKPSSISRKIITDFLRKELGFNGIIITDAMNMKGVTGFTKPSFEAIKAGCDMVLFPSDENALIQSVLNELKTNEEFKKQIENSVKRIIKLKICLGLVDLNTI